VRPPLYRSSLLNQCARAQAHHPIITQQPLAATCQQAVLPQGRPIGALGPAAPPPSLVRPRRHSHPWCHPCLAHRWQVLKLKALQLPS